MGRVSKGFVSLRQLSARTGIRRETLSGYARQMGLSGGVPPERADAVCAEFRRMLAESLQDRRLRARKGFRAAKLGLVTMTDIGSATGCNGPAARYILNKAGWPRDIPADRLDEAVSVVKEALANRQKRHVDAVEKEREYKNRWRREHRKAKKSPSAPEKTPVPSKPCDWRVSMLGKKGWLVVRCGTQDEMEAWARMLRENGFVAEAAENMYKSEVK